MKKDKKKFDSNTTGDGAMASHNDGACMYNGDEIKGHFHIFYQRKKKKKKIRK